MQYYHASKDVGLKVKITVYKHANKQLSGLDKKKDECITLDTNS
jgi:hypothetical protein